MKNMKFKAESTEESKEIQELLFQLGYKWRISGLKVSYLGSNFIYACENGKITYGLCLGNYTADENEETTLEQLRAMVHETKFKKGDKVLCWDDDNTDKQKRTYAFYADGRHWVSRRIGGEVVCTYDQIELINSNKSKIDELEATIKRAQEQIEELKSL